MCTIYVHILNRLITLAIKIIWLYLCMQVQFCMFQKSDHAIGEYEN